MQSTTLSRTALPFILWGLAILVVGYAGNDDKFITYFVADRIAAGEGIRNLNGAYLEQSSTFLFTYLLAGVTFLTGSFTAQIGYGVSISLYLLCLWPAAVILRRFGMGLGYAVLVLAAPPVIYWSASGMENSFYLLMTLGGILVCARAMQLGTIAALLPVFLLGAGLPLTRPEGLHVVCLVAVLYLFISPQKAAALRLGVAALSGVAAAIGFRLSIGLPLFPLPVYSKTQSPLLDDMTRGLQYFVEMGKLLPIYTIFFVAAAIWVIFWGVTRWARGRAPEADEANRPLIEITFCFLVATLAFPILAGGDWMPFGRFLTVPVTLAGVLFLITISAHKRLVASLVMAVISAVGMFDIATYRFGGHPLFTQYSYRATEFTPAWSDNRNAVHTRDLMFIDALLKVIEAHPKDELVVASVQMGMVPYYILRETSKDVRFFDFRGLATIDVHECNAVDDPFQYRPFDQLQVLQDCHGQPFDLIFDRAVEDYVPKTEDFGCTRVFGQRVVFQSPFRGDYKPSVFIADCSQVGVERGELQALNIRKEAG